MIPTINDEQKQQLRENGYFLLENVFTTDEMIVVARNIESFQQRHEEKLRAQGDEGISRAGEITFTSHLAEQDDELRRFCTRPEFVAITTQLLAPDIDLYWNQAVFKAPEGTKEFPWHQDDGYISVTPTPYLTLWLALNDATEENGCISVLPGSHKNGVVPHYSTELGQVCHDSKDPNQGVRVPVKAGSMAVFWSQTFHKSGPNVSDGTRKAYVIQYANVPLHFKESGQLVPNLIPVARNGQTA